MGELLSPCAASLGKTRGEGQEEGQERLCLSAGQQHTLLCCSCLQHQPAMALCVPVSPWGHHPFFMSTFIFIYLPCWPSTSTPWLPSPGAGAADMSQGRGTQDALWILELSLNSKETLIYALSPRKYFFKRHCSYLGCSYTTASHK